MADDAPGDDDPREPGRKPAPRRPGRRSTRDDPAVVFAAARALWAPHEHLLVKKIDEADNVEFTSPVAIQGRELWIGAVILRRNVVSFHFMPMYVEPALLDGTPDALRAVQTGKSCFRLRHHDRAVFDPLSVLLERGLLRYKKKGWL